MLADGSPASSCTQAASSASEAPRAVKAANIVIREIMPGDLPSIAALLSEGFPDKRLAWFDAALETMSQMPQVHGLPRFGYALLANAQPVGAVLTFCATHGENGRPGRRLNVACWYVRPRYRAYGTLLYQRLLATDDVTCLNVTPAEHTWPVIAAQGFARFADGCFVGLPVLGRTVSTVRIVAAGATLPAALAEDERRLLEFHAGAGCVAFVCITPTDVLPFVFRRRPLRRLLPTAQLIYCRDLDDLERCAGAVGRHLAGRGLFWVIVGANGPLRRIPGRFFGDKRPMYYKGSSKPRLGDLAYTELALLPP